jgi:hypothetical protein
VTMAIVCSIRGAGFGVIKRGARSL